MTTIVYRDGVLASDSLASYGDSRVPGNARKLFRLKDGSVAGVAGSEGKWRQVLAWLDSDRSGPQPSSDGDNRYNVVVLRKSGRLDVYEDGYHFRECAKFMAWGSGQAAALGALHAGADAIGAVRAAILVDKNSGGKIQTMRHANG